VGFVSQDVELVRVGTGGISTEDLERLMGVGKEVM
jgi:hypothetical protein